MFEPLVVVHMRGCQADYWDLALKARPYSALLQKVTFTSREVVPAPDGEPTLNITLLAPPSLVENFREPDVQMEHMAEQILFMEIMRVCEREGILSRDELYG
jgi:hypothetical protein